MVQPVDIAARAFQFIAIISNAPCQCSHKITHKRNPMTAQKRNAQAAVESIPIPFCFARRCPNTKVVTHRTRKSTRSDTAETSII
jgi:hypothetical protein